MPPLNPNLLKTFLTIITACHRLHFLCGPRSVQLAMQCLLARQRELQRSIELILSVCRLVLRAFMCISEGEFVCVCVCVCVCVRVCMDVFARVHWRERAYSAIDLSARVCQRACVHVIRMCLYSQRMRACVCVCVFVRMLLCMRGWPRLHLREVFCQLIVCIMLYTVSVWACCQRSQSPFPHLFLTLRQ
jgi:hypothetical protein